MRLSIYDTNGELVENLFEGNQSSGIHFASWNASRYSSGTYFCRMNVDGVIKTSKLIYLK